MEPKTQRNDHVVIVTSDAEDAKVKTYRIRPAVLWTGIILVCVIVGTLLGFIAYEKEIWDKANQKMNQKLEAYEKTVGELEEARAQLEKDKEGLIQELEGLNSKIVILSDTITQMKETEEELTAAVEKYATPTLVPITGSATIEEILEPEAISIFQAAEGAVVVSTASGRVAEIGEDSEFGHRIVIDHGNGYTSVYRNKGEPVVATGDSIAQGGTLFVIGKKNKELGYQITKDGAYVKPSEVMEIKG